MAERDKKGRFAHGNSIGEETRFKCGGNAAENAIKANEAKRENTRKRKTLTELALIIGDEDIETDGGDTIKVDYAIVKKQYAKAMKGDTRAFDAICKLRGEMTNNIDVTTNGKDIVKTDLTIQEISKELENLNEEV